MKTVLVLLIAAIAALIGVVYFLIGGPTTNEAVDVTTETPVEIGTVDEREHESLIGQASLAQILALGHSLECQLAYDAPGAQQPVEGTYFVSGENVRGDFIVSTAEYPEPVVSSVIFDGTTFYSWSEIAGETYGVKMQTDTFTDVDGGTVRQPVPQGEFVDYTCNEWKNVDGSIFLPPSDVLFQDASQILDIGMEYGTIYNEGEF